jgi:hypothetical protein
MLAERRELLQADYETRKAAFDRRMENITEQGLRYGFANDDGKGKVMVTVQHDNMTQNLVADVTECPRKKKRTKKRVGFALTAESKGECCFFANHNIKCTSQNCPAVMMRVRLMAKKMSLDLCTEAPTCTEYFEYARSAVAEPWKLGQIEDYWKTNNLPDWASQEPITKE